MEPPLGADGLVEKPVGGGRFDGGNVPPEGLLLADEPIPPLGRVPGGSFSFWPARMVPTGGSPPAEPLPGVWGLPEPLFPGGFGGLLPLDPALVVPVEGGGGTRMEPFPEEAIGDGLPVLPAWTDTPPAVEEWPC